MPGTANEVNTKYLKQEKLKAQTLSVDTVSGEQAYLSVAGQPRIQKPVVLKRKTQKGEGRAVLIGL